MITCVIDACSYIYLHKSTFPLNGGKEVTLFKSFTQDKNITIRQSAVVQGEILRHISKIDSGLLESPTKIQNRNYKFGSRRDINFYDQRLFNNKIATEDEDAGEKANFAVCLDSFRPTNNKAIIYLTDDKRAIENKHLKSLAETFPYFLYWTSFDVILFLFFNNKYFSFELAEKSIQDVISFLINGRRTSLIAQREKGVFDRDTCSRKIGEMTKEYQETRVSYIRRLTTMSKLK